MAEADIKCEMKKTILELQSLTIELGDALGEAAARVDADEGHIGHSLRTLYERANARSEELLGRLDRLQADMVASRPLEAELPDLFRHNARGRYRSLLAVFS